MAGTIPHAWYRCQALTAAAEQLGGKEQMAALSAAFAAAKEQSEPNRVVTVACWPVRVLAAVKPQLATEWISELLIVAETEHHNLRRSHALQSLAFVTLPYPKLVKIVTPALVEALLGGHGPRIDRVIRDTFEIVRSTHPQLLRSLALHHKAGRQQQKLLAAIPCEGI
ncbi:hypothetical protein [Luteimonas aquatica]|uniref:hypothetical protein n=1 Tax=Luteimonas aquatica TaxID=450364 RepID=UPI001F55CA8C|nr:hypothetical protein [Luteimonas aquatica]